MFINLISFVFLYTVEQCNTLEEIFQLSDDLNHPDCGIRNSASILGKSLFINFTELKCEEDKSFYLNSFEDENEIKCSYQDQMMMTLKSIFWALRSRFVDKTPVEHEKFKDVIVEIFKVSEFTEKAQKVSRNYALKILDKALEQAKKIK